jgi:hypothetical protein
MTPADLDRNLRTLVEHAWDREITWSQIQAWANNFTGQVAPIDVEREHGLIALSRFIYFGKRLVREMLRSLYRDHFESPLIQRVRRNCKNTRDATILRAQFVEELRSTRFIGVGNPSESGAHLLYYFRQINRLSKDLFVDIGAAFSEIRPGGRTAALQAKDLSVGRYVFFDDVVGSGDQSKLYLSTKLRRIREANPRLDLRFMCLFASSKGLETLNSKNLFNGKATSLFELDDTYKVFNALQRYFPNEGVGAFDTEIFEKIARHYGQTLCPGHAAGYKEGQFMLGFTHNTPDNTLPIYWNEGRQSTWNPIFVRYDKVY